MMMGLHMQMNEKAGLKLGDVERGEVLIDAARQVLRCSSVTKTSKRRRKMAIGHSVRQPLPAPGSGLHLAAPVAQANPTGERLAGEVLDRERERWVDDASPA
jgi:hypothetical protein